MNRIILIGNLSSDVERRETASGKSVASFNLAVNRRFTTADGDRQTDFFRVSVWGKMGDACAKHLAKGNKVAVIGEIQPRLYDAKNGQQRLSLDVQADEVEFLPNAEKPKTESRKKENSDGYDKTAIDDLVTQSGDLPF